MDRENLIRIARRLAARHCVANGKAFSLESLNPADTGEFRGEDKRQAREVLKAGIELMAELQERLYADGRWAVLVIFQGMDASGKDGAIKHVMSGVNPQGCQVHSFKAPSAEELDHDFLWRCHLRCPARGRIGIFNRSYYEETLVVRVHPEWLQRQRIARVGKNLWQERFEDIRGFERHLYRNGTVLRKLFLHVSFAEQRRRFLERIENPDKNWKFSIDDVRERAHWKAYMAAYEETIRNTATSYAPWFVIPADHKWYARIVVASIVIEALVSLDLRYPELLPEKRRALKEAKRLLMDENADPEN
ncbi:MAG: polyphosphate kinase 2 family protein [Kiritimatiellae bacterium]|nr:polyphosphate kinase 2 family protein [Kiritimatiellia bacterium]MDW8458366.1 polyphosphate kinase 2 family protein [Verrucomicrobiota bacterium]